MYFYSGLSYIYFDLSRNMFSQKDFCGIFDINDPKPHGIGPMVDKVSEKSLKGGSESVLTSRANAMIRNFSAPSPSDAANPDIKIDKTGQRIIKLMKEKGLKNVDDSFGFWKVPTQVLYDKIPSEQRVLDEEHLRELMVSNILFFNILFM